MIKCIRCENDIPREVVERMLPITDLNDVVCISCNSEEYGEGGFIHYRNEVLFGSTED